jgi:hypothetical protein
MKQRTRSISLLTLAALLAASLVLVGARSGETARVLAATGSASTIPLKDAKLNIEHNATDRDTGFQGFIDSEGWRRLAVTGPAGDVLAFEGRGALADLGLTELFFETVEPTNKATSIKRMLAKLPAGKYTIAGPAQENARSMGETSGVAWLTHDIPRGPKLISPVEDATVPVRGVVAEWAPVQRTITGKRVKIIAYQLIIERDVDPHRHMIGKLGLSMYLSPSVTRMEVPDGFLQRDAAYNWEVLAIERSGNQTLSSGSFRTR